MANQQSIGSECCTSITNALISFEIACSDGDFDEREQAEHRAQLREAALIEETKNAAVDFAIQVLRIPQSAPNKPLMARLCELAAMWRAARARKSLAGVETQEAA